VNGQVCSSGFSKRKPSDPPVNQTGWLPRLQTLILARISKKMLYTSYPPAIELDLEPVKIQVLKARLGQGFCAVT